MPDRPVAGRVGCSANVHEQFMNMFRCSRVHVRLRSVHNYCTVGLRRPTARLDSTCQARSARFMNTPVQFMFSSRSHSVNTPVHRDTLHTSRKSQYSSTHNPYTVLYHHCARSQSLSLFTPGDLVGWQRLLEAEMTRNDQGGAQMTKGARKRVKITRAGTTGSS